MTTRELQIMRGVLQVLHDAEGGQFDELTLHRAIADPANPSRVECSAAELRAALAILNFKEWITGVQGRHTGRMKWSINDAGEAALLELQ